MIRVCPACGARMSEESWDSVTYERKRSVVIARLPQACSSISLYYVALFRSPDSRRGLTGAKSLKLFCELEDLFKQTTVVYKNESALVTPAIWAEAMERMVNNKNITRPLKNHNYLISVALEIGKVYEKKQRSFVAGRCKTIEKNSMADRCDDVVNLNKWIDGLGEVEKDVLRTKASEELLAENGGKRKFGFEQSVRFRMFQIWRNKQDDAGK